MMKTIVGKLKDWMVKQRDDNSAELKHCETFGISQAVIKVMGDGSHWLTSDNGRSV